MIRRRGKELNLLEESRCFFMVGGVVFCRIYVFLDLFFMLYFKLLIVLEFYFMKFRWILKIKTKLIFLGN